MRPGRKGIIPEVDEAIVLAGGLGTRLRSVVSDLPKPMAPVAGRPFLAYLLDYLASQGIRRVILAVGYRAEHIVKFFGLKYGGLEIVYAVEDTPLGTGGGIARALQFAKSPAVFVINGDTFLKLNYPAMATLADASSDFLLAVALREIEDASRYGRAVVNKDRIEGFDAAGADGPGLINAGVYLVSRRIFDRFPMPSRFSFEKDFLEIHTAAIHPFVFSYSGPFLDIGVPSAFSEAQTLFPKWIQ